MRSANDETSPLQSRPQAPEPRPVGGSSDERFADWAVLAALGKEPEEAQLPEVGDRLANCLLLAELGRGTEGRVFLAAQADLGDRLIVLKVTPTHGGEHLALARLVHTHIAPLLFARDVPESGLRLLAMPFVGGTSLLQVRDHLLERSAPYSGQNVVEILARSGPERPTPTGSRHLLGRLESLDAPTFVAWLGACLADALGHAHERGLMHLDVKPGNVLLAADGTPLLLDFHLAQQQIAVGAEPPEWFGGTEGYMAPEQRAAGEAFHRRENSPAAVDGRADLYALGVMLFEMLAGARPDETPPRDALRRAGVSPGLAAILSKCMQADPNRRYPEAAMLADDLRRHLAHRPLRGVPNRSLGERWRKWRRRNPGTLWRLGVSALVVVSVAVSLFAVGRSALERRWAVEEVIAEARRLREQGNYAAAVRLLEVTPRPGGGSGVAVRFDAELDFARQKDHEQRTRNRRAEAASELARLANRLRLGWDLGRLSAAQALQLKRRCVGLWDRREELTASGLSAVEREELAEVCVDRATALVGSNRLTEARACLDRAIALQPELGEAWYQRGVLRAREGDRPEAITDLERAVAANAPAGPTHYNLAVLYHEEGRSKEAREHLRRALEEMPKDAEALRLARRIEKTSRKR